MVGAYISGLFRDVSLERSRNPPTPRRRTCVSGDGCVVCAFPDCYSHASRQYTTTGQPVQSLTVMAFRKNVVDRSVLDS